MQAKDASYTTDNGFRNHLRAWAGRHYAAFRVSSKITIATAFAMGFIGTVAAQESPFGQVFCSVPLAISSVQLFISMISGVFVLWGAFVVIGALRMRRDKDFERKKEGDNQAKGGAAMILGGLLWWPVLDAILTYLGVDFVECISFASGFL